MTNNITNITVGTHPGYTFQNVCEALAEGEHNLGDDATAAGAAIIEWPGSDCPWFVPHPEHIGGIVEIARFDGFDLELSF